MMFGNTIYSKLQNDREGGAHLQNLPEEGFWPADQQLQFALPSICDHLPSLFAKRFVCH